MQQRKGGGLAVASLVVGIIGLFLFGLPLGLLAIVFGAIGWEHGTGKAGVILGIIDVAGAIWFLSLF